MKQPTRYLSFSTVRVLNCYHPLWHSPTPAHARPHRHHRHHHRHHRHHHHTLNRMTTMITSSLAGVLQSASAIHRLERQTHAHKVGHYQQSSTTKDRAEPRYDLQPTSHTAHGLPQRRPRRQETPPISTAAVSRRLPRMQGKALVSTAEHLRSSTGVLLKWGSQTRTATAWSSPNTTVGLMQHYKNLLRGLTDDNRRPCCCCVQARLGVQLYRQAATMTSRKKIKRWMPHNNMASLNL